MRVATLDDRAVVSAADPGDMLGMIAGMGDQLRRGFDLGQTAAGLPSGEGIDGVVVCGMGGSGVAGDVVRASFGGEARVPILAAKGYALPAWCGRDSLVLAVSFSGDTEETVAAYAEAVARGCRAVTLSGGGRLAALSDADGTPHVTIPPDVSMPRAAVGSLAGAAIGVLSAAGVVTTTGDAVVEAARVLGGVAARCGPDRRTPDNEAKSIAHWLSDRIPLAWGSEGVAEAAALRWKNQFNENAKMPAFHAVLPELDHNEIEGMAGGDGSRFAALVLRHRLEHPRVAARVGATADVLAGTGLEFREMWAEGSTPLEAVFSLIMLGDFVTVYTAILRGVDPTPVPVLTGLKERLRQ